jgi:outer membrane protein assembly factor BamB
VTDPGSTCPCCGQTIPARSAAPAAEPNPVLDERAFQQVWQTGAWPPAPRPRRTREASTVGCLLAAFLTFLVVTILFTVLAVSSGDGGGDGIDPGSDVVLPVPGADPPSWIVEQRYSSEPMRVESGRGEPRWVAEPLEDSGVGPRLAVDDRHVYASDGRRVLALDLASGAEVWSVTMDDDVEPRTTTDCTACFELVGGRLVVTTIDGEIHLLDEGSGDEIWSHRYGDTSGRALVTGGSIVLIDQRGEGLPGSQMLTVDPRDGDEISRVAPECAPTGPNDTADLLSTGDAVDPVDGEAAVIVEIGTPPACRQRIDVSAGKTVWSAPPAEEAATVGPDAVQHDGVRYTGTYAGIERLDLGSGEQRLFVAVEEDEGLVPAGVVDGMLLVTSRNNRGSTTSKLVGVDVSSGDRVWSHDKDRVLPPNPDETELRIGETSPMWLWAMGGEEVRVLTFAVRRAEGDTEPTVTVERLDARTGTLRSTTDTPLDDAGSSFEMNVLERGTDSLVVNLEGRLKVLDTRTGRVTDEWP